MNREEYFLAYSQGYLESNQVSKERPGLIVTKTLKMEFWYQ